jgi:hypothetical protein
MTNLEIKAKGGFITDDVQRFHDITLDLFYIHLTNLYATECV